MTVPRAIYQQGHPALDDANFGWVPNPAAGEAFLKTLPHAGTLAKAAPDMIGDGDGKDLMPYLAMYEVDASPWKPKDAECPYNPQTGNNCTSEGCMHVDDLLQMMAIAEQDPAATDVPVFHRTCVEANYAFGLSSAGMRGDQGCYGSALAKSAYEIGRVSYDIVGDPKEETHSRLVQWADNPAAIVAKYKDQAAPFRYPAPVKLTTTAELQAWLANSGLATIASNVGFNAPRDEKGICRRAGRWPHQMAIWGRIVSDGTPTFVIVQSWGPNNPQGPQPFRLPSFCFRAHDADVQTVLDDGDTWGFRSFPGFERKALPSRWTYQSWGL